MNAHPTEQHSSIEARLAEHRRRCKAKDYAKTLFMHRSVPIMQHRQEEVSRLRLLPRGGGREAAIAKAHVDCIQSLATAYAESQVSAYEQSGIPFDQADLTEIVAELRRLVITWFN